jgi:hypothetical protein
MSSGNKKFQLVEEESPKSKEKDKNSNNNSIGIKLSKKKSDEDEKSMNSAECSGEELKSKTNEIIDTNNKAKPITLSKGAYERYTERLREKTMIIEADKIYNETERLKKKYEEKNSYLHLFNNSPQFQKMLKNVSKQLVYIFIEGILINIFSSLLYFYITKRKEGLALSSFCLSISELSMCIILFVGLRLGLLNDPNLSKAFRLFVIMESILLITSFIINIIAVLVNIYYFKRISEFKIRIIIYILFLLMIIIFIITLKNCINLFVESILILLSRKTEYSILMIKELKNKNDINFNVNSSTISNNITTEGLVNNSTNIFVVDNNANNANNNTYDKNEEEKYKAFNYFNKFHYSVSSTRNNDYGGGLKK